ncbi:outer membrane protein Iml2/Tetratricopeptide repeat protein 39 [Syncephalis pseudoplumigaleata]|uniref:Outer membrane protein Iml2/Tetratricopeptide repeat protein 39 n=1 Tax=Syncephalis pseudoplumigaleata TaxID=1712513 RepID=A0A4P9YYR1_9FUNG|nr:outer membrane protein Iml2/Tetratricopeptide repeat protein 39 [Syncephalis pseudoplumigaleata]|eukprot:RKP25256.1 outer membrane protein Iml2/Tetratricopeptide repeat protein 39 [Syncephalis pseudoplumigaleata]
MKRNNSEIRDDVIGAEGLLLTALIQLLQESVVGFLKAGLNLRRGYKQYETLWREVQECGGLETSLIDRHTLSGVAFGLGTINVVLSALPTKILRLVSVFGYVGDRELGFDMLNACLDKGALLSPLALMLMIFFYAALTPFAPEVLEPIYGEKADKYIAYALEHYPDSPLYGVLVARHARQQRDLEKAVRDLTRISDVPWAEHERFKSTPLALKAWEALYHLCSYELGMTELYRLNFAQAAEHYRKLAEVRYWSQITCRYLQAVCMEAAGDAEGADLAYSQIKEISVRKYSGRVISSDQYVLRKVKMRDEDRRRGRDSWRGALEVLVIWNGHTCMRREQLERCRDWAEEALKTAKGDDRGVTLWISGCILKELGELDKAEKRLHQAVRSKMHHDTLVGPFARYEQGVVAWLRGDKETAKKHWNKAQAESHDYNFEFR